jgi:hypothetical protein
LFLFCCCYYLRSSYIFKSYGYLFTCTTRLRRRPLPPPPSQL